MSNERNFYETIIVGAGFAGASTAYNLLCENNYKGRVLILEARDRIGGRAYGQVIGGKHVELGCSTIHGLENNPILDLSVKYGLVDLSKDKPEKDVLPPDVPGFTQEGERVPKEVVETAYSAYAKITEKAHDFYQRVNGGEEIEEAPLGQYIDEEVNKFLLSRNEEDRSLLRAVFNQMIAGDAEANGTNSLYDLSLKYCGLSAEIPGGNLVFPKGFGNVVQGLIDDTLHKAKDQFELLLNHEVTKIKWHGVEANSAKQPIEVACANGALFKCNHLVNTMPVGVLKARVDTLYEPTLPQYKVDSIKALNFGDISKIYLEYEQPLVPRFFDPSLGDLVMVYHKLPEDVEREVKEQTSLAKHWSKKINSVTKINDRLLLLWLGGKETRYAEKLDNTVLSKEITGLLRSVFGKSDFPEPSRIVQTSWSSNPFTNGSYTAVKLGGTDKDIEQYRRPIFAGSDNKSILLFAGEGCHPTYFSTTHGAYLSGKQAATDLLK